MAPNEQLWRVESQRLYLEAHRGPNQPSAQRQLKNKSSDITRINRESKVEDKSVDSFFYHRCTMNTEHLVGGFKTERIPA